MKKEFILIPFILLIIVSIFFYPIYKGEVPFPGDLLANTNPYNLGIPDKAQGTDVLKEFYPWNHFVIEMLKQGQVPFWNPYNFSGNPLMANFQSASFYPLNLLFLPLPFNAAWTLYIFLIPLLSALFTYLFLREIKISKLPSLFGGIVFAFSSYMIVWMEYGNIGHTFLWLPLALLFTEKLTQKFNKKHTLLLIFTLSLSLLAGYIQGYFYITAVIIFYYLAKTIILSRKKILGKQSFLFLVAILSPLLLSAFQLLSTLELFQHSTRNNYSLEQIEKLLNPFWYVITIIAPDFFGNPANRNHWFDGTYIERVSYFGAIPFILACIALINFKKRKETIIFGSIFIISLILSLDILFTKYIYQIHIPILSTTVPTRILSLFTFSGAILAAIGLDSLLKNPKTKKNLIATTLPILLLSIGWAYALINNITVSQRNLILPSLLVISFIVITYLLSTFKRLKTILIIAIFAITIFDLFRFFHKITPFSPEKYIYPNHPVISYIQKNAGINRYWGYGSGHMETNIQLVNHTFLPDGHDALHIKDYTEFLSASKDGKPNPDLSRSDSEIATGFAPEDLQNNSYRQKTLNILGVKYILMKDQSLSDNKKYKLVFQENQWKIYENINAAPRAFLTTDYKVVKNKKDQISLFFNKNFNEKKTIILEEDPRIISKNLKTKNLKLISYTPNKVSFSVTADSDALLFLSDTYYPGWKATIDGKQTKIFKANSAFRAVKVTKGEHKVDFTYQPQSFQNGLMISGITLTAIVFAIILL